MDGKVHTSLTKGFEIRQTNKLKIETSIESFFIILRILLSLTKLQIFPFLETSFACTALNVSGDIFKFVLSLDINYAGNFPKLFSS